MFPYAHTKSIPNISIELGTQGFHTAYLKVVYPPSDKLVKFLYLIAVANAPTTTGEFSHSLLKLRH